MTDGGDGSGPVHCVRCGRSAEQLPLTWMTETDPHRGPVVHCDRCVRDNLRAVEAKLPHEWW